MDTRNQVLEVNINSPIFRAMLDDTNKEIRRVLNDVYQEKFDGGEITIKLKLGVREATEELPTVNSDGEMDTEDYSYRYLRVDHTVTSTLKKSYKQEGYYCEPKELEYTGTEFIVKPLPKNQIGFFEDRGIVRSIK